MPDFTFHQEHTSNVCTLTPVSEAASNWVAEYLPEDVTWFGKAIAIESRYAGDILEGIQRDDLTVEAE